MEQELNGKTAVVIGAGPGIGRAVAERLAEAGACIVVADIRREAAREAAAELQRRFGNDRAADEVVDCTQRESARGLFDATVRRFGRLDILAQTAAVFFAPDATGRIADDQWRKTLDVNLLGAMIAADEAGKIMAAQPDGGGIVLLGSANAVVAKRGSSAYDAGKAALNHLIREMAIEFAPKVRVNGVAPASVVEGSLQFPRERVMTSLAKYNIAFDAGEATEALREKLAAFYAGRTLLQRKVSPADVAEAVFLLASDRLRATTGHILPVDAGLTEAFLR